MAQSNTKYSSISLFWWNRKKCEDKKERMEDAYKGGSQIIKIKMEI